MHERTGRPVVITGGAGFVGANLAERLLQGGSEVLIFDNLSRAGVEKNLTWLKERHGSLLQVVVGDVRDGLAVREVVSGAAAVFHLAAQVAVTTSLTHPIEDFEVNARGTLNVLEAVRQQGTPPPLVFTSTNKVYGGLGDVMLEKVGARYTPASKEVAAHGIGEARQLDFHSPYGCSKGAADQYVLDYARTYGVPATVFRMSCIYGPRQFGTEDQGWVVHFLLRAVAGAPLTLYGDGMQVRDILFVEDLVEAFLAAHRNIGRIAGRAFNIGGGVANTTSLLELLRVLGELCGVQPTVTFSGWRPGDQRYYVSDVRAFGDAVGWAPQVGVREGLERLYRWVLAMQDRGQARPAATVSAP
ncbi:NAD-dependent epimerase/dehydratase [Chondromyces apiculatus DSM 436]|uniref:NAD-dependent epimerase/dehydratase n=1 Tax=Chondromyces apiculatus DSM 436 TaxID=1192034 RepID=A0A017T2X6_9BACT|nr:NAD-dependent epimerase/dehydratase [Chondromyces apiculatus DSM 436]